jgi:hypothetical protein
MTEKEMTPEQVENWRKVLCEILGPYALIMPVEDVHKFRDKLQKKVNTLSVKEGKK